MEISLNRLYDAYYGKVFAAIEQDAGSEAEYKTFVRKFYEGTWLATGWVETTSLGGDDPGWREAMNTLGQRICGEWAKPNHIRSVTTDQLQAWHDVLGSTPNLSSVESLIATVERKLPRPLVRVMKYGKLVL